MVKKRIGAQQIDCARNILKEEAKKEVVNYQECANRYSMEQGVEFDSPEEATKYFFKVLSKSPGGIYFPREISKNLSKEQLETGQNSFKEGMEISEISKKIGSDLIWDDLFVGFNAVQKKRGRKNKNKPIALALDKKEDVGSAILEMHENNCKIPEIMDVINAIIQNGVDGIDPETKVDALFTQYFIHSFKGVPRTKHIDRSQKEQRVQDIKTLFEEGKSEEEILEIVNKKYNGNLKLSSLKAMISLNKLNPNPGKRGKPCKYTVENFSNEILDFISIKYGREGLKVNKVCEELENQFNLQIPAYGLTKIIKSLKLTRGTSNPTEEQIQWLQKHAPSCLSQEDLAKEFNENFETSYEECTIRKFHKECHV